MLNLHLCQILILTEEIFSYEGAEEFSNDNIGIVVVHLCAFNFVTFVTLLIIVFLFFWYCFFHIVFFSNN